MVDYRDIIKSRELRLKLIDLLAFIPDKPYLKMVYRIKTGKKLRLNPPVGFNDKLQWMKLYDRHPEYTDLCDKVKVREIIQEKLGPGHTFPLLGTWKRFEDIDFSKLPDSFVLKCNHDSGSVKFIRDKNKLTEAEMQALSKFFRGRLRMNPYHAGREYPYKDIEPCIIAEPIMGSGEKSIKDYKFFCFHGEPKIMFVATDRETDLRFDFFDMEFNHLDIENLHPHADIVPEKPACFDELKRVASVLSEGKPFVRIDLFEIDGQVYFGEYTIFHAGGFSVFTPNSWDKQMGDWIRLEDQ